MSPARSQASLAAALLTQRLVEAAAAPFKASEYWDLLAAVPDPAVLLGADADAIAAMGVDGPTAARAASLLEAATSFAFEVDRLEQSGLRVIASVDDEYPPALLGLGRGAPPLLYAAGDPSLLQGPLVGVVGSREVGEAAAEAAKAVAREAVGHGHGVVSGGAKGVDRLAMNAALETGGAAVGVLADSLLRTTRDPDVRRAVVDGNACLCTPYKPSAGFSVANAMGRNKLIYALSVATVVVAAEADKGGTWAGAVEAVRQGIAPVVVWQGHGATEGNARLVAMGAHPLPSADRLFPLPAAAEPPEPKEQLALEV